MDQTELSNQISRLEARIEDLSSSVEKSRKAILASKVAITAGALLAVTQIVGIIAVQPLAVVMAIAAIFGGIVGFGANVSTARQDTAALKSAEAKRAELISLLTLREIGRGTSLTLH
jgi:hypothetical protein